MILLNFCVIHNFWFSPPISEIGRVKIQSPKKFFRINQIFPKNRKIENSNFLTSAIAGIMQLFFNAIALFLTIFAILFFLCIFYVLFKGENYIYIFNYVIATPTSLMLALIIRGIANEIGREKDKNYIFTAFSGIVGFVALIVALVALFKGVG